VIVCQSDGNTFIPIRHDRGTWIVSSVSFGKVVTLRDPPRADTRLRIEAGFSCSCLTGWPYPLPLSRTLIQKCSLALSIATSILEAPPCRAALATASASIKESSVASASAIVALSGATKKEVVQFQYLPASSTTFCNSFV
jgi:hypothetical protein